MSTLNTKISNYIGFIEINRPEKLNALNKEVLNDLSQTLDAWRDNEDVRVIVLRGAGDKAFVAGADIKELSQCDVAMGTEVARDGQVSVFDKIEYYPKVVIAAVNGWALGGGLELAMSCHIRVASNNAKFGQPETNLGLIPGYGGTQRLPQIIGKGRAYQMLLSGLPIDADRALQFGLVTGLSSTEDLDQLSTELAESLAEKSPLVNQKIIQCVNSHYDDPGRDGYETEIKNFGACFGTEDAKTGMQAFLNKEKPVFKGK